MMIKARAIVHDYKQPRRFDSDCVVCSQQALVVVNSVVRTSHKGPDAAQQGVQGLGHALVLGGIEFSTRKVVALECDVADKFASSACRNITFWIAVKTLLLPLVLPILEAHREPTHRSRTARNDPLVRATYSESSPVPTSPSATNQCVPEFAQVHVTCLVTNGYVSLPSIDDVSQGSPLRFAVATDNSSNMDAMDQVIW